MSESQNFANHPKSITEHAAEKDSNGQARWTVRDVLVSLLRDIDSGKLKSDVVFVAFRRIEENGDKSASWASAGDITHTVIGVAELALTKYKVGTFLDPR